jgi:Ca2+-binding RTX toxin-like protein
LVSKLRLEDVIMLEILILSILGFAGTAIGGLVTSDDEGNAAVDEEDAGSDAADDLSGDLLLETLETEIPIDPVVGEQVGVDVLIGSDQDDVLTDWTGSNEMYGGDGDDTLQGGFDVGELSELHGDAGNDTITAIGTDTEGEVDEVYGGEGDDTLQIRGATEAYGGEGADTFTGYFNTWVDEAPTVLDYNAAEDQLEVDIYAHEGVQELDDFDINVQDFEDGSGASIYVDGIEVMRIPGAQGLDLADVQLNLV